MRLSKFPIGSFVFKYNRRKNESLKYKRVSEVRCILVYENGELSKYSKLNLTSSEIHLLAGTPEGAEFLYLKSDYLELKKAEEDAQHKLNQAKSRLGNARHKLKKFKKEFPEYCL